MPNKMSRIRDLLIAIAAVTNAVPTADIRTNFFKDRAWPVPGLLIQGFPSPTDSQTWTQDQSFATRCYGLSDVLAESLHQIVRTALTGLPEFAIPTQADEDAQRPLWIAQGITYIMIEPNGGQRLVEPNSGKRGGEFVLAQYRATYADS